MNDKLNKHFQTKLILAFGAVYIIWGTTYLAIRYGVETIPALLMAGVRFVIAGSLMYAFARWKGSPAPTKKQWIQGTISGILLFLGGNGALTWAEQYVPSGLAALLVASIPFWIVLISVLQGDRSGLTPGILGGVILGFAGITILINPSGLANTSSHYLAGALVVIAGSLAWAFGSLYTRKAQLPSSPVLVSGMQMFTGGIALLLTAYVTGEVDSLSIGHISTASYLSLLYLIVFGSIGFLAYTWLLGATSPARVATYAYVNPIVAVIIGWLIGGEEISGRAFLAAGVIIAGVILIISQRSSSKKAETKSVPSPAISTEHADINKSQIVTRVWRGVTPASKAEDYVQYLRNTGEKECLNIEGNKGVSIMKRIAEDKAHFLFISQWDSYDAIRKFAGEDIERAVFFPKDREYLIEAEEKVTHYEVEHGLSLV